MVKWWQILVPNSYLDVPDPEEGYEAGPDYRSTEVQSPGQLEEIAEIGPK